MKIKAFFEKVTSTLTYVCHFPDSQEALIVDPVWNYDGPSGKLSDESFQEVKAYLDQNALTPCLILETHVHADHVSGAALFRKVWPQVPTMIGARIGEVQKYFKSLFNCGDWMKTDGSQFQYLMGDGEERRVGPFVIKATAAPGHTPVDTIYQVGSALFLGDVIFVPDFGTGRCDFPMGSAKDMYHSVHDRLYKMDDNLMVYTGHDYQPGGRELRYSFTVKESKESNIHIKSATSLDEFVHFRTERDKTLSAPTLILPSIQINMNGGELPPPEHNGKRYLKIPLSF